MYCVNYRPLRTAVILDMSMVVTDEKKMFCVRDMPLATIFTLNVMWSIFAIEKNVLSQV